MLATLPALILAMATPSTNIEQYNCAFGDSAKEKIDLRINHELDAATIKQPDGKIWMLDLKRTEKTLVLTRPNFMYEFFLGTRNIGRLQLDKAIYVMGSCSAVAD